MLEPRASRFTPYSNSSSASLPAVTRACGAKGALDLEAIRKLVRPG